MLDFYRTCSLFREATIRVALGGIGWLGDDYADFTRCLRGKAFHYYFLLITLSEYYSGAEIIKFYGIL